MNLMNNAVLLKFYYDFFVLYFTGFVDIGWESPAGQSYSSVADLAQLMLLMFRDDQPAGKNQVIIYVAIIFIPPCINISF